ncbi:site-specific DNA-methyltransferase [Streptomyces canus]|uniref:site-specific DNA-methyltransferase n=1 Tax=Streptomyces canus TaxID=58343 RepID=UPI0033D59632
MSGTAESGMTMERVQAGDAETHSMDVVSDNVEQLKVLFPDAFTEGKIDFEVLKQILGGEVEEGEEKYGLSWRGKRRARQIALTQSAGTLRPCPQDSVDWDTTQNLMIEGDNLEVLKLLQKSYAGKVKLIYIDPPYNTGKDFVYADNFRSGIDHYLTVTQQVQEGGSRTSSERETYGRMHTAWLDMMMPRLRLARNLLKNDGAIFISCDDIEAGNVRALMDEIFGSENFVAQFVWQARKFTDARAITNISTDHEYIICYSRNAGFSARGVPRDEGKFANPDEDPRGPWMSRSILGLANKEQRPNLHYTITEPHTGRSFDPDPATGWRYAQDRMAGLIESGCIIFPKKDDGRPREKKFRADMKSDFIAFRSVIDWVRTSDGSDEVKELLGEGVFPFPKPTELIRRLVEQVAGVGDVVLDFFSGSGSTGHAVMKQNIADGAGRKFILVQLPEILSPANRDQGRAVKFCGEIGRESNISEITKERLRRAGAQLKAGSLSAEIDTGFRVFKLDKSNIRPWDATPKDLEQETLDSVDNILPGRSEQDVLYELLLHLGLDLCVPIETRVIGGKDVHAIGGGVLFACLPEEITPSDVEAIAHGIIDWHKELDPIGETKVYFRDSAFTSDEAKTNIVAILEQYSEPESQVKMIVRSL